MMEEEKGELPFVSCASATAARLGYPLLAVSIEIRISGSILP